MNKFFLLSKAILKNSLGAGGTAKNGKNRTLLYGAVLLVCMLPSVGMIGFSIYQAFALGSMERELFLVMMLAAFALILMTTVVSFPTQFYFSKDLPYLLPLPLHGSTLVFAKLLPSYVLALIMSCFIMVPTGVGYFAAGHLDFISILSFVVMLFLLPACALFLIGTLLILILSLLPLAKNKDRFLKLVNVLVLVVVIGFVIWMNRATSTVPETEQAEDMIAMISSSSGTLKMIGYFFFWVLPFVDGIAGSSFISFISLFLMFVVTAVLGALFGLTGSRLYLKSAASAPTGDTKTRKSAFYAGKDRAFKALFWKEQKVLFRNQAYFFNCVIGALIVPVIIIVSIVSIPDFHEVTDMVHSLNVESMVFMPGLLVWAGLFMGLFAGISNAIAPTSFSREGTNMDFFFALPVSFKTFVDVKLMTAVLYPAAARLLYLIPIHMLLNYPVWMDLFLLPGMLIGLILTCQIGILIDGLHPKLNWDNETAAVKNNMNIIVSMMICLVLCIVIGLVSYLAYTLLSGMQYGLFIGGLVVLVLLGIASWYVQKFLAGKMIHTFTE